MQRTTFVARMLACTLVSMTVFAGSAALASPDGDGFTSAPGVTGLAPVGSLAQSQPWESNYFGSAVAIAADGTFALVSAPAERVNEIDGAGAVYVFRRINGRWVETQRLSAPVGVSQQGFGFSIALSGDGLYAFFGAPRDTVTTTWDTGATYVFKRTGDTWAYSTRLVASDRTMGDQFGIDVATGSDGSRVVVGARNKVYNGGNSRGEAYVFVRNGTVWTEEVKLFAPPSALQSELGRCVALSANGDKLFVGAPYAQVGAAAAGAIYPYVRSGTTWTGQPVIVPSDGVSDDAFGWDCATSANGNRIIVGKPMFLVATNDDGGAYVYTDNAGTWSESKISSPIPGFVDISSFGWSVAISPDGLVAAVGGPRQGANHEGKSYMFAAGTPTWTLTDTQTGKHTDSWFGNAVAFTPAQNGLTLIGSREDNTDGAFRAGHAYVYGSDQIFKDAFGN
jgi:hypothetical protein